ncbi:MAG: ABC transporter ATP-binding protein [Parvibaculaceae bacterium]
MTKFHMNLIEITKRFGDFTAVERVSLSVEKGEFLTLLGPSGSGKTTLLRMLGGFEYPTSGTLELHGADVAYLPPYKRNIGMVFQKYALFPHLTVIENIAYPLRRRKVKAAEVEKLVKDALELVGLGGFGARYPRQLSGGQQQRVALARAVVFHPELLLMDEPLGALDKKLRDRMQVEIRALQKRVGITTVYVTHDQIEAMTMSDRVAVMNHGRIEQIGTPRELYDRPMTEFVAGFIGDSNLVPAVLDGVDGNSASLKVLDRTGIRAPANPSAAQGKGLKLLIRPEKLRVSPDRAEARENWLEGTVRAMVFLGDALQITVAVAGTDLSVKIANRTGEAVVSVGQKVVVSWSKDDCSLVVSDVVA